MKRITQSMEYEQENGYELTQLLKAWNNVHPLIDSGINWEFLYVYATMTDEDCLAFILKHPQFSNRFKDV